MIYKKGDGMSILHVEFFLFPSIFHAPVSRLPCRCSDVTASTHVIELTLRNGDPRSNNLRERLLTRFVVVSSAQVSSSPLLYRIDIRMCPLHPRLYCQTQLLCFNETSQGVASLEREALSWLHLGFDTSQYGPDPGRCQSRVNDPPYPPSFTLHSPNRNACYNKQRRPKAL